MVISFQIYLQIVQRVLSSLTGLTCSSTDGNLTKAICVFYSGDPIYDESMQLETTIIIVINIHHKQLPPGR